jgi:hypothetical protein
MLWELSMKRIGLGVIVAATSAMLASAQPAKDRSVPGSYVPGLGEFMAATQVRHAKLWFAGENLNWALAAWEVDEIREGLEDAAKLHATHDVVPVAEMIKSIIDPRLEKLDRPSLPKAARNSWPPSTISPTVATLATPPPTSPSSASSARPRRRSAIRISRRRSSRAFPVAHAVRSMRCYRKVRKE